MILRIVQSGHVNCPFFEIGHFVLCLRVCVSMIFLVTPIGDPNFFFGDPKGLIGDPQNRVFGDPKVLIGDPQNPIIGDPRR